MEPLSYKQFSALYPICDNATSSEEAWGHLLRQWRDAQRLRWGTHWNYAPSPEGKNQPTRFYDPVRVVKLILLEAKGDKPRPRILFLCQHYLPEFKEILTDTNAAIATVEKQDKTPSSDL